MRDKVIHDYFGVDLDLVWMTVIEVLPAFRLRLAEIIATIEERGDPGGGY